MISVLHLTAIGTPFESSMRLLAEMGALPSKASRSDSLLDEEAWTVYRWIVSQQHNFNPSHHSQLMTAPFLKLVGAVYDAATPTKNAAPDELQTKSSIHAGIIYGPHAKYEWQ